MNQIYPMVAKTFQGLEDVLSEELIALGAQNVEAGLRMVTFEGDLFTSKEHILPLGKLFLLIKQLLKR